MHTTTKTEITFDQLPDTGPEGREEFHEVTVVLLDTSGHRIGESAFFVRFQLKRKQLL